MTEAFRMRVDDTFSIAARGIVMVGTIESGLVRIGDRITVNSPVSSFESVIAGVEIFRKLVDSAGPGDIAGILLRQFDPAVIKDGCTESLSEGAEGGVSKSYSLTVVGQKRPWWKF